MAWLFDGVNDYVTLADAPALTLPSGDWTVAGWVRIVSNAGTGLMYFFSWNGWALSNSCNWSLNEAGTPPPNKLLFCVRDGQFNTVTVTSAGTPGASTAWQHLLLRRSGSTIAQYVNGVVDGAGSSSSFGAVDWNQPLYFGGRSDLNPDRFFYGAMAEWAKWDRALSTEEIAALVAGTVPGQMATSLRWYLPMLDYEEKVAGLTVTNYGSTLADHPPQIATGSASYRVAAAELFFTQAAAAELFTPGTVAGQAHV